jgi:hypothetical protein
MHTRLAIVSICIAVSLSILQPSDSRASGVSAPGMAPSKSIAVPVAAARPEDVSTIDGIVKAFYEVVSGPPGRPRQWSRDRTLYIPGVQFVAMNEDSTHHVTARAMTHQQLVDHYDAELVEKGFFEHEIHRKTERFGNIAHILSAYESRYTENGAVIARGVNSIELFWDGRRWWIVTAIWDEERADNPMPKELLP